MSELIELSQAELDLVAGGTNSCYKPCYPCKPSITPISLTQSQSTSVIVAVDVQQSQTASVG
jgi:hypothetical protein